MRIIIGFKFDRFGYRLQGLIALCLSITKLIVIDMTGGTLTWHPEQTVTLFRGYESIFIGACALIAGILYFRSDLLIKKAERKAIRDAEQKAAGDDSTPGNT